MHFPKNLGELRKSEYNENRIKNRSVKEELRSNLIQKLKKKENLFPGIVGYDDTVIPEIINAILSKHNIIFLGLRGQAKSRIMRQIVSLLDEWIPVIEGCEISDNPYKPICRSCHLKLAEQKDETPVSFVH